MDFIAATVFPVSEDRSAITTPSKRERLTENQPGDVNPSMSRYRGNPSCHGGGTTATLENGGNPRSNIHADPLSTVRLALRTHG
jgi:hypothetical protein